jgi:polysaccharide export outer membrane protein
MKHLAFPRFVLFALLAAAASGAAGGDVAAKRNYAHKLQLADLVRVAVFGEDDLTTRARVDSHGHVALPLIGEIAIGGLTVAEAQDAILKA